MIKIYNLIFKLDVMIMYIFLEPMMRLDEFTLQNSLKNLIYYLRTKNKKKILIFLVLILFFIFINIMKVLYLPIILFIYFSKIRFAQINYNQIGAMNEHINFMTKKNFNEGYKTVLLIPKSTKFSFISKIFKNLIIIKSDLLNIILLPLKHTSLVSCKMHSVDLFLNKNYELRNKNPKSKIQNDFFKKYLDLNLFELDNKYISKMEIYLNKNFPTFNFKNFFVFHQRDDNYKSTSNFRGSDINSYKKMIEFVLSNGYSLIRLINNDSKKLSFDNSRYLEINTDLMYNMKIQYYLIYFCKGLVCNSSGPASIGSLFSKPVYDTNNYGSNVNSITSKGTYITKKITKNGTELNLKELLQLKFFEGVYACTRECKRIGLDVINNSEIEILEGFKDFLSIQNKNEISIDQKKFKENLPNCELKYYKSNIAQSFIRDNKIFFKDVI